MSNGHATYDLGHGYTATITPSINNAGTIRFQAAVHGHNLTKHYPKPVKDIPYLLRWALNQATQHRTSP